MSDTPETDALVPQFWNCGEIFEVFALCRKLERERDEALEDLDVAAIHSCHNECQRPMCVLRRERDELLDRNAKLRAELEDGVK